MYPPGPEPNTSTSHFISDFPEKDFTVLSLFDRESGFEFWDGGIFSDFRVLTFACSFVSNFKIRLPSETLSPALTFISRIIPATGEGTSMVALSLSTDISGSSSATLSSTLQNTSIISKSSKSPISGTFTSMRLITTFSAYLTKFRTSLP